MSDPDSEMATIGNGNARMIHSWVQNQLCSFRLAAYQSEIRGESKPNLELDEDDLCLGRKYRPYGIPWEWQGAVEDVWGLVFEYVYDPEDIISLCEASDLFQWMLRRKYVEARLPEVLDVCFRHNLEYFRFRELDENEEPIPNDFIDSNYYVLNLRLKVRLLSRMSKRAIEQHLNRQGPETWDKKVIPETHISSGNDVDSLVRKMDEANIQNDGTFYPTRLFVFDEMRMFPNLRDQISNLLRRIGRSIQSLRFFSGRDHEVTYDCVRVWTGFTPNLVALEVQPKGLHRSRPDDDRFDFEVPPFPVLAKLRAYVDAPTFPMRCRERIIEANPGLQILLQEREWFRLSSPIPVHNVYLPIENLQGLQLEQWKGIGALPPNLFQSRFIWPLKRLTIIDFKGRDEDRISSQALFGFVNTFQTLEVLHLELPVEDDGGNLLLPNLRKFKWRIQQKFELMDFIIPLEKLERLHVFIGDYLATRLGITDSRYIFTQADIQMPRQEVLQFFQGLRGENFRETNLKIFFPRLRSIKICKAISAVGARRLTFQNEMKFYFSPSFPPLRKRRILIK